MSKSQIYTETVKKIAIIRKGSVTTNHFFAPFNPL